jgi:hypothetical protein
MPGEPRLTVVTCVVDQALREHLQRALASLVVRR